MADSNWQVFFDGHAAEYMENCFVTNTIAEVDFVIEQTGIAPGARVLDIGCGTGRHSVELAKRGYRVTGVDLSPGMLAEARKTADEAGVEVEFVHSNAADYTSGPVFNAAVCLCEGAFGLLGAGDDPIERDLAIMRNVQSALKPGSVFILTALSGINMVRQHSREDVENGVFDPVSMSRTSPIPANTPEGERTVEVRERGYVPTELAYMARLAGFEDVRIYGGTAGNWGHRTVDPDEMEIMLVARKPA